MVESHKALKDFGAFSKTFVYTINHKLENNAGGKLF